MKNGTQNKRLRTCKLKKIISGGQTGVDRAALDVAIHFGLAHGGWCPRGRLAEDGRVPAMYDLVEMDSANYADRTRQNVLDADATLILYPDQLRSGTRLTAVYARELGKEYLAVRLDDRPKPADIAAWINDKQIKHLNIAGPRASSHPRIYSRAKNFLTKVFDLCLNPTNSADD
jgi:Circularly permutated YpsA SLOG family